MNDSAGNEPDNLKSPEKGDIGKNKLDEGRRRLPINVVANITWIAVNALVLGWYTPFLINKLGVASYGLIPLTNSLIQYANLITQSFNSAVSRYLTISLVNDDWKGANKTFNSALVGLLIIACLLLPLVVLFSIYSPAMINVLPGSENQARILVLFTGFAFLITTFANSFAVSSFAYHRFDMRLFVNISALASQIICVVALFHFFTPNLWQAGVAVLLYSLTFLFGHIAVWRKLTPGLKINIKLFQTNLLRKMSSFSSWVAINQAGSLLFLNIDLVVANVIFGATIGGRYGAVLVLSTVLRSMAGTILGVLSPIVMTLYAKQEIQKLVKLIKFSVKFLGLAMALPIGLLCGFAKPILYLWLGPEFVDLSVLLILLVSHLTVNLSITPLFYLNIATDSVRLPGIVSLISGVTNVVLAVSLASIPNLGYLGIAMAGAIVLTVKNSIFTPIYGARTLNIPWWTFYPSTVSGMIGSVLVGVGSYYLTGILNLDAWGEIFLVSLCIFLVYSLYAYFLALSKSDRNLVRNEIGYRLSFLTHSPKI